jgi:hypothetical protein
MSSRIEKYVSRARRRFRLFEFSRGLLTVWSLILLLLALFFMVGLVSRPGGTVQALLGLVFVVFVPVGIIRGILWPLVYSISGREIVDRVEEFHPDFHERLSTTRYLEQSRDEVERLQFSPDLIRATFNWSESRIRPEHFEGLINWNRLFRPVLTAVLLTLGLLCLAFFQWPQVSRVGLAYREAMGGRTIQSAPLEIETPGRIEVDRGGSTRISAHFSQPVDSAVFHFKKTGQEWESRPLHVNEKAEELATEIRNVRQPVNYFVSSSGAASSVYQIQPVDPPRIEEYWVEVNPPVYTGLDVEKQRKREGSFTVPAGSQVILGIKSNNNLSGATIHLEGQGSRKFSPVQPNLATIEFTLERTLHYEVDLVDAEGRSSGRIGPWTLEAKPDRPPRLFIHHPPAVSNLPDDQVVALEWEVLDDYGVGSVELNFQLNYLESGSRISLRPAPAESDIPSVTEVSRTYQWNLRPQELLPGDEVSYYLVATDNDGRAGPKAATSEVQVLRLPTAMEMYEELEPQATAEIDAMQELLEQQRQIKEDVQQIRESMEERAQENRSPGGQSPEQQAKWEEQQNLEQLGQQQENLGQDMEQLQAQIEQTLERLNDPNSFSFKTMEKMARVQDLMNELLSDEMKMLMQQFQMTLEEMSQEMPMDESMMNLEFSLEDFEENLDRTISLLENSLVEQQVEAMRQQIESLEKEQSALEEESRQLGQEAEQLQQDDSLTEEQKQAAEEELEARQEEAARKQEELNEKTEKLLEQMEKLARQEAGENEQLSQSLNEALKQAEEEQLQQSQENAAMQMQSGQMNQAAQSQQKASQALSQMKQNMESLSGAMGGMNFEQDMVELRRSLDRALVLSERQEAVGEKLAPEGRPLQVWGGSNLRSTVSIYQRYYRDEALRIEEELLIIAKKNPFLNFSAIRHLRLAARAMDRAVFLAEDQNPPSIFHQVRVGMDRVNRSVLELLDSLNQLAQAQSSSDMQSYFQNMQQLIQRQRQLNMRTRQQQQQQGMPDWQQEMQRLAREQSEIRRQTQELFRKYGRLKELLGRLDETGNEMMDVEKELEDQNADERVQEKQERILSRLMDAEKSMQEKGFSRNRQSETAGDYDPGRSPEMPDTVQSIRNRVQKLRQGIGEEQIPMEYRERVRRYFERLSEESG